MVIGGGGHAKVVISTLRAVGYTVAGVFDDDPDKWGTDVLGAPVRGQISDAMATGYSLGMIAIGDNIQRRAVAEQMMEMHWITAVHPAAYVDPTVELGPGTVVFAGAVVQPGSRIRAHVIVNTGATVDHDCYIGDYVHLAPGAHLAGSVEIGAGSLLGIGSAVVPHRKIGSWTTVGAGAVVVKNLPDNVTAVGIPARQIR